MRFGLLPGEDPAESRDKIQAGVAEVVQASRVTEIAHLVAHLLRVPFDDSPVVTPLLESPQRLEARLFMALKRLLTAEAETHPVVIVVENLELCGTDTINFLQYLAAGMRDQRGRDPRHRDGRRCGSATPRSAKARSRRRRSSSAR